MALGTRSLKFRLSPAGLLAMALFALVAGTAAAADHFILGKMIQVLDPTGAEGDRRILLVARERQSDVSSLSDPTVGGATLMVVARGGMSTSQPFELEFGGWTALAGGGYRYTPTSATVPVRKVILKRTAAGIATLKVMLDGDVGVEDLSVRPPSPGDEGGIVLAVGGGDRYCVTFGGAAGGHETQDSSTAWKVVRPDAENGCPTPVCGNDRVEGDEQCDGGGFSTMCFFGCTPSCTCSSCGAAACSYDLGVPCCNATDICANAPGLVDVCLPTTCSQPADCSAPMGCENGSCCVPPSQVLCGVSGSFAFDCCGEAVCVFDQGQGTCCLPSGATCDGSVPCCSGNCTAGTCD